MQETLPLLRQPELPQCQQQPQHEDDHDGGRRPGQPGPLLRSRRLLPFQHDVVYQQNEGGAVTGETVGAPGSQANGGAGLLVSAHIPSSNKGNV